MKVRNGREGSGDLGKEARGDLQEPKQVLTVNTGEKKKSPHASSRRMIKGTILQYARAQFFNKVCPKGRLDNQSLTYCGVMKAQLPGGKEIPNSYML